MLSVLDSSIVAKGQRMAKQMTNGERDDMRRLVYDAKERAISTIEAADPDWKHRVESRLRKIAIGQLGIDKEAAELAKIDAEMVKLTARREDIQKAIERKMPKEPATRRSCPMPMDMCSAVNEIVQKLFVREKLKDVTGKKVDAVEQDCQKRLSLLATCETRADVLKHGIIG